jgi:KDO2-lipid IV(A) lauroyltransferase
MLSRITELCLGGVLYWISFLVRFRVLRIILGAVFTGFFRMIGYRNDVMQRNLKMAQVGNAQHVQYKFYEHFGQLCVEMFLIFGSMRKFVHNHVDFIGKQYIENALKEKKGIIFVVSHLGNWEIMTAAGSLIGGTEILMVTKKIKPQWFHKMLEKYRLSYGVKATYEPNTMKDILRHLKRHQAVGVVIDQYLGPPVGVRVPFFGIPVGTSGLAALLAYKTSATVLFAYNYRKPNGDYVVVVEPQPELVKVHPPLRMIRENTLHYVQALQEKITLVPEQWLWSHRRFKGDLSPISEIEWGGPRIRS